MNQKQANESELATPIQNQQFQLNNPHPSKTGGYTMEEMIRYYNEVLFGDAINTASFENPFDAIAQSSYCGIKDSTFSFKSAGGMITGVRQEEHFYIILPTSKGKEFCFIIKEKSDNFQRVCVEKPQRKFELSFHYNINTDPQLPPHYDYSKTFMNAYRIGGGFCTSRQEVRVISPDTQQTLGRIIVNGLETNVFDKNDILKYKIKFYYPLIKETICCLCCAKTRYVRIQNDPFVSFDFKIYENNQEVGEIKGIPYKIIFPLQATIEDKILIIVARIFITYIVDPFESFGKKCMDYLINDCPCCMCFRCCCL